MKFIVAFLLSIKRFREGRTRTSQQENLGPLLMMWFRRLMVLFGKTYELQIKKFMSMAELVTVPCMSLSKIYSGEELKSGWGCGYVRDFFYKTRTDRPVCQWDKCLYSSGNHFWIKIFHTYNLLCARFSFDCTLYNWRNSVSSSFYNTP